MTDNYVRSSIRYTALFIGTVLLTLAILVTNTFLTTINEEWEKEGRAYNTKYEMLAIIALNKPRLSLLRSGEEIDSWKVRLFNQWANYAYESALKKIDNDDYERVFFYYITHFLPRIAGKSKGDIQSSLEVMESEIRQFFHQYQSGKAESEIVRISGAHVVFSRIAGAYLSQPNSYEGLSDNHDIFRQNMLFALHSLAINSDPVRAIKILGVSRLDVILESFDMSYSYLANEIIKERDCESITIQNWLEVSDITRLKLIENDEIQSSLQEANKAVLLEYNRFESKYSSSEKKMWSFLNQTCPELRSRISGVPQ